MFSKQQMGQLTWTLMHLYSAYVPDDPTDEEKEEVIELYRLL